MMKEQTARGTVSKCLLRTAAEQFSPADQIAGIISFGTGNVNDTFIVSPRSDLGKPFILQRMNGRVFSKPQLIMQNLRIFSDHVSECLKRTPIPSRRWETPQIILTADSKDHWIDFDGCLWRAISYIGDAESFSAVNGPDHAAEIGFAVGLFHSMTADLPPERLHDTLEGFHITPAYLHRYYAVLERRPVPASADEAYCMDFIDSHKEFASVLEKAKADGRLPLRVIHGDPKVGNVMIDTRTRLAVSLVDLDTVKPGLVLYDIGDSLRSCCNPLGENPDRLEEVRFEPELCRALLKGYFTVAGGILAESEYSSIFDSIRLLPFELGMRFFTDYLEGNVYFKVKDGMHNLRRAMVQFRLAESIELQAPDLHAVIREAKNTRHVLRTFSSAMTF